MYPMYRFMDPPHLCQMNQVPHYYPHLEPNPHHMNIDPTKSYEPWPSGGNYGYPYPPQCHNCCTHNNSPNDFAFRPPYPYFPPSPYNSGSIYHAYPGMYPAPYVPPPHFNMEQPRYEYEKNMSSDRHCCGCPNHQCNKKGGSTLKIEEHHDLDKKNESNESLVPSGFKNSPYPVVWLPPDYLKNREQKKPKGFKDNEDELDSQVVKPHVVQPNVWDVLSPYLGKNSESTEKKGESARKQHQHQDDEKKKQFPFPIIWMPYKSEAVGGEASDETDSGHCVQQESTSPSKPTVPRLHDAECKRSNSKENEVNSGSEIHRKGLKIDHVIKTIPVRQVKQDERVLNEKKEDASREHDDDAKGKKVVQEGKKQSSSPTKSSKLPPVCLRVDPLPRKKSSKGSSRSPSPPGGKEKVVDSSSDSSKPPILSKEKGYIQGDKTLTTGVPEKRTEIEPSRSKSEVVEVSQEEKLQDHCSVFPGDGDTINAAKETKCQPDGAATEGQSSNEGNQSGEATEIAKEDAGDDMKKSRRRELSDDEAATIVQSAYRGFNVRRWEPLKKLKQITNIKEQMAEFKNRIQAFGSSADNGVDSKQKTIMTEAIMDLLLKLDTIQGLHPTVRECRKSVAKELVSLQEKLDLLNCKEQPTESEQAFAAKSSVDTCSAVDDDVSLQGGQEVQRSEHDDELVKGNEGIMVDSEKPCEEQLLCATQVLSTSNDFSTAEVLVGKEENKNSEEATDNCSSGSAVETEDEVSESPSECKDNPKDKITEDDTVISEKSEENAKAEQSLSNPIPSSEEQMENAGSDIQSCGLKEKDEGVNELEEFPKGVFDEETGVQGSSDIRKDEAFRDKSDLTAHVPEENFSDTVILGLENMHNNNRQEQNAVFPEQEEKYPRHINEDAKISEVDDKVGMMKNGEEVGQCGTPDVSTVMQSQQEGFTMIQATDTTNTEESEAAEVLPEKMQNADKDVKIPDIGKSIELSTEPQLSSVKNNQDKENHVIDKQEFQEKNIEMPGGELPSSTDAMIFVPAECKVEEALNLEMKGEESVAVPVSEGAISEMQVLGEKELDATEDQSTYPSAEAANCFGSILTEVQAMDAKEFKEWKEENMLPSSPTASQVSYESNAFSESDRKLIEENEKLREMMEKLIKAGTEQLSAISRLSGKVKDLEKRLSKKKKLKLRRNRVARAGSVCMKPSNDSLTERSLGLAM